MQPINILEIETSGSSLQINFKQEQFDDLLQRLKLYDHPIRCFGFVENSTNYQIQESLARTVLHYLQNSGHDYSHKIENEKPGIWLRYPPVMKHLNGESIYIFILESTQGSDTKNRHVEYALNFLMFSMCSVITEVNYTPHESSLFNTGNYMLEFVPEVNCEALLSFTPSKDVKTVAMNTQATYVSGIPFNSYKVEDFSNVHLLQNRTRDFISTKLERNQNFSSYLWTLCTASKTFYDTSKRLEALLASKTPELAEIFNKHLEAPMQTDEDDDTIITHNDNLNLDSIQDSNRDNSNDSTKKNAKLHKCSPGANRRYFDQKQLSNTSDKHLQANRSEELNYESITQRLLHNLNYINNLSTAALEKLFYDICTNTQHANLTSHDYLIYQDCIHKLQLITIQYLDPYVKQFELYGYLLDTKLQTIHNRSVNQVKIGFDGEHSALIEASCKGLYEKVAISNQKIIDGQAKICTHARKYMLQWYHNELRRFRKEKGPFHSKLFSQIAVVLEENCMQLYISAVELKDQSLHHQDCLKNQVYHLRDDIQNCKKTHMSANATKYKEKILARQMKKSQNLVISERAQSSQTAELDSNLSLDKTKSSGSTYLEHRLENVRRDQDTCTTLKTDLDTTNDVERNLNFQRSKNKVLTETPHSNILDKKAENLALKYKKRFEKDLKNFLKSSQNLQGEQMEAFSTNAIFELEKDYQGDVRNLAFDVSETVVLQYSNNLKAELKKHLELKILKEKNKTVKHSKQTKAERKQIDAQYPLVYLLTLSEIRMGVMINESPIDLKNKDNSNATALFVAQKNSEKIVYGEELASADCTQHLRDKWNLGEMLKTNECKPIEMYYNGTKISVHLITLLAFLFQSLKISAEKKMLSETACAVVIVPFFFTSFQRQLVQASLLLAGFADIRILSDLHTLAYEFVNFHKTTEIPDKGTFLIINDACDDVVDVSIVFYNKKDGSIKFCTHSGSYHHSEKTSTDIISVCWNFLKSSMPTKFKNLSNDDQHQLKVESLLNFTLRKEYEQNYSTPNNDAEWYGHQLNTFHYVVATNLQTRKFKIVQNLATKLQKEYIGYAIPKILHGGIKIAYKYPAVCKYPEQWGSSCMYIQCKQPFSTELLSCPYDLEAEYSLHRFQLKHRKTELFQILWGKMVFKIYTILILSKSLNTNDETYIIQAVFEINNQGTYTFSCIEKLNLSNLHVDKLINRVDYEVKQYFPDYDEHENQQSVNRIFELSQKS